MREVVLDTETTGLHRKRDNDIVCKGHRIIEVACVEIINGVITGRTFHSYIRSDHPVDPAATAIHGITNAFLCDKPLFSEIAASFISFLGNSLLIIHNAPFDIAFLDQEFRFLPIELQPTATFKFVDTLPIARTLFPARRSDLDSFCDNLHLPKRNSKKHGALEDALLLAAAYLKIKAP